MRAWLVGPLALIGGAAGAGGVDPSFAPGAVIPQQLLAVADLNGDGKPDLAVASASNDVRVLLGNGAGVFRAARGAVSVDGGAHSGVSADFDGDGRPDLAVATSRTITVLLGDGAGGFHLAPSSPIAASGTELAAADLNGDGKTDLVLPTRANGRNTLTILLGDGSGRFAPTPGSPLEVPGRDGWSSVAVADFNRDGKPDLAGGDTESKQISILLGDGAGGFRAAATARVGTGPRALVAADFNGDRNLDLAVASTYAGTVTILLGDGAGSFRAAPGRPIASGASAIALADFNRDGRTDLAVATVSGVVVLLGEGAGRFRAVAASSFRYSEKKWRRVSRRRRQARHRRGGERKSHDPVADEAHAGRRARPRSSGSTGHGALDPLADHRLGGRRQAGRGRGEQEQELLPRSRRAVGQGRRLDGAGPHVEDLQDR